MNRREKHCVGRVSYHCNYLGSNLTTVGLFKIIKLDEKFDATLFKKSCIFYKKTKKNGITFGYLSIVHKS